MDDCKCLRCQHRKPSDAFHWQLTRIAGKRVRVRDKTCKVCRAEQKRARDRTPVALGADPVIARFLSLPVAR